MFCKIWRFTGAIVLDVDMGETFCQTICPGSNSVGFDQFNKIIKSLPFHNCFGYRLCTCVKHSVLALTGRGSVSKILEEDNHIGLSRPSVDRDVLHTAMYVSKYALVLQYY